MDNTWYYTLSTIVQALASLLALGATFLVFKLQTLDGELRNYRIKAIRTIAYLEGTPESSYDDSSLIDISNKFSKKIRSVEPTEFILQLGRGQHQLLQELWISVEGRILNGGTYDNDFLFRLDKSSKAFASKVQFRLKLYFKTIITGLLLTFTIVLALAMLGGLTRFLNPFNISEQQAVYYVTSFACISVIGVLITAVYAIWGDDN